jgi:hypothetical protein
MVVEAECGPTPSLPITQHPTLQHFIKSPPLRIDRAGQRRMDGEELWCRMHDSSEFDGDSSSEAGGVVVMGWQELC